MATSLAKQLQKLSTPGQGTLKEGSARFKPSFLFDPKEAPDIDVEEIHALGCNGLEELVSLEPAFAHFSNSLFSDSCRAFERSVQSRDSLKEVDAQIGSFLRLLSPYFLLRPTHKCLEWLIRVFNVHCNNVDDLVGCVLPYYQTNLFVRVVQLLPLRNPQSMWHWLLPVQKQGTPLSRLTLAQRCITDPSLLSFVCEMVPCSLKALKRMSKTSSRTVISFYCSCITSVFRDGAR